ncbi:hypothetical protein Bca52824_004979 [Brassica carinata]|uniref:Protein kinase domain-containing protein n=1 Tax=Brassica carinata TaxID=52824 RepID=A0A8X7WQ02_BRACI|nr:hypothetical protein Bca52824_004979 [Brassica carinata]
MMNCFPCFTSQKSSIPPSGNETSENNEQEVRPPPVAAVKHIEERETEQPPVKTFNFRELATATKNFRQECLLGEGGSGRVYKGTLQSTGQLVAVKQLDKHGLHGTKEFQAEVLSLSKLEHPNLVKLIGYCADGDQRLLVFEYVSGGSLPDHLFEQEPGQKPIDWLTRMKIAFGAAQGLDYLHDKVNPPVIYRDLKAANILLDDEFYPKLCDYGLNNLAPGAGDSMFHSSCVMDTYGYSAPEYTRGEDLTVKSDVYSFGVVLLELITGRRAVDTTKPNDEQNLVAWAQPIFRDPKRYPDMADPLLKKNFSERDKPSSGDNINVDVMVALSFLSMSTEDGIPDAVPILSFRDKSMSIALSRHGSCSVTPFSLLQKEGDEDSSSVSSESEDDEKKEESKGSKKKQKEDSDDESGSDDEKGQEEVEKPGSSKSSSSDSGSERASPIDESNATAQSLEIKYSYSSEEEEEEEDNERLSSSKSDKDCTSFRYDSERNHDDSPKNTSIAHDDHSDDDDDEDHETRLEDIHSSKSEAHSVYSDDDDDDAGESSLNRAEPEEGDHGSSDEE